MLSKSSSKSREIFVHEFTREVLFVLKQKQEQKIILKKQLEELNKKRDIEKLKLKYIDKKVEQQQTPSPRYQQEQPPVQTQVNHNELFPSVMHKPLPLSQQQQAQQYQHPQIAQRPQTTQPTHQPNFNQAHNQFRPTSSISIQPPSNIEFGKILPLIKDPNVTTIECAGADKPIIVKKNNQTMNTEIKLDKKEITKIINDFSDKARIPLIEGLLRARVDNLQISAVVSKVASSRFIIIKTQQQQLQQNQMQHNPHIQPHFPNQQPRKMPLIKSQFNHPPHPQRPAQRP